MAFIMPPTRNGSRRKIRVEYLSVKQALSRNRDYVVTHPVPNRYQPHLANAVRSVQVRNIFLFYPPLMLLITHANLTNISHDPLNASRRAIKTGMFADVTRGGNDND